MLAEQQRQYNTIPDILSFYTKKQSTSVLK